jgi:hypothetical protein
MICQKPNCLEERIPRGKYCIFHRTGKRRWQEEPVVDVDTELTRAIQASLDEEKRKMSDKILEDRKLIEEQRVEYEKTVQLDRERLEEMKKNELAQTRFVADIENKRRNIQTRQGDDRRIFYTIKFLLPTNFSIKQTFEESQTIHDIYTYIDVVLYDHGIINTPLSSYHLYLYPHQKILDSLVSLKEMDISKTVVMYISID